MKSQGLDVDELIQENCKKRGKNVFHYVAEKVTINIE